MRFVIPLMSISNDIIFMWKAQGHTACKSTSIQARACAVRF